MELTEQQARAEFNKLSDAELIALAESEGKPTQGQSRKNLIDLLLGKCPSCNKGIITVTIISPSRQKFVQTKKKSAPCLGCGK